MDIPGYEIAEPLGAGGFGTVYRARQLAVQREVALKVDGRTLTTERDRRRFMREVTAAGRLSGHPHVVAVYDAGVLADGRPYMVLELCPGGSLNDRLHDHGPFPPAEVRDVGVRIADALAAAHGAGVVHRDVKPGNILVDRYGNVALADFGLAAMPAPGMESSATRGSLTPAYAPPEAFHMAEPTPAGDVYSLAASLYALLQGRPPHFPPDRQLSIAELMGEHPRPVPDLPGVPAALTAVLREAMAYDPANRPRRATALRDALAALDLPAGAGAPPVPYRSAAPANPAAPHPGPHPAPNPATHPSADPAPSPVAAARTGGLARSGGPTRPDHAGGRRVSRELVLGAAAVVAAGLVAAGALAGLPYLDRTPDGAPAKSGPASGAAGPGGAAAKRGTGAGAGGGAGAAGYGVPAVTQDCPAAAVTGARAACTRTPECWGGIVSIAGDSRATRYDCRTRHTWETFAIALMPPDGETWNADELQRNPTVAKVCSRATLLRSRQGSGLSKPAGKWDATVLPPSQAAFEQGNRVYRCMASLGLDGLRGSSFRPIG